MHRTRPFHPSGNLSSLEKAVLRTPLRCGALFLTVLLTAMASGDHRGVGAQEIPSSFDRTRIEPAVGRLLDTYPDVRVERDGLGATLFYGAGMSSGLDPDLAVDAWWRDHADAFAVSPEDRELMFVTPFADDRAIVFAYRLSNGGIEIEGGVARFVVRRDSETGLSRVVYAAARTALPSESGFPPVAVPAASATAAAILALPDPALQWFEPVLVITPGVAGFRGPGSDEAGSPSRLAWHVRAHRADASNLEAWSVIVDPVGGAVLEIRDEIVGIDIEGEVLGFVSPAPFPATASNPSDVLPIGGARVRTIPGAIHFSETDGSFLLPNAGSASIAVESSLVGEWITINDLGGPATMEFNTPVLPPGPVQFFYDPVTSEYLQAQVNGFHFGVLSHDFFRDRTPSGIPGIDIPLPCNVNINDVCNAAFDPFAISINFFRAGAGCVNSAYSNVVSHEYGHFVVDRLNLGQGSFGEGFGDVVAMFMYDDPIIGRDFQGPGSIIRNPIAANIQFPCTAAVHVCGQLLGATWWQIRSALGNQMGSTAGLEAASQLFVDWSLITIGAGNSSAQASTAIEILTVDDDDGTLTNGTPHFTDICNAFDSHSIACPVIPVVVYDFPVAPPLHFIPGVSFDLPLTISDGIETTIPSTAQQHVRTVGSTSYTVTPLLETAPGAYLATIPSQSCGDAVEYFFSIETTAGFTRLFPVPGAGDPFETPIFDVVESAFTDTFETDTGWSAGVPGDTATTGVWTRVNPVGTAAAPEDDHTPSGSVCYVTGQGVPGGNLGANDVDDGFTTLMTPPLDLSAPGEYVIEYWRWFSNDSSAQPNTEVFRVDVSGNNGATWVNVEEVGPSGPEVSGGWFSHSFDVGSLVPLTATVRVRFVAEDPDPGSLVEAGVDDFEVIRLSCNPAPQFQRGDVTADGSVNIADAIEMLGVLFLGTLAECRDAVDVNDTGTLDISDPLGLLEYFFSFGVPPAQPFGVCGVDATADPIDCVVEPPCP